MLQTAQGSLTMVGLNTDTPKIFWNGALIEGITSVRTDWEDGEKRVRLKLGGTISPALEAEMVASGITIKKGN
jgi:uncharacterized protein YcsI (UPF0317 family)